MRKDRLNMKVSGPQSFQLKYSFHLNLLINILVLGAIKRCYVIVLSFSISNNMNTSIFLLAREAQSKSIYLFIVKLKAFTKYK